MTERTKALVDRFNSVATDFIQFAESIPEDRWGVAVEGEDRPVGVIVHHVADSWATASRIVQAIADGVDLPPYSMEMVDQLNAEHAANYARISKADTLAALRANSAQAAAILAGLTDEQLDRESNPLPAMGGRGATPQQFAEMLVIGHPAMHLPGIQAAVQG